MRRPGGAGRLGIWLALLVGGIWPQAGLGQPAPPPDQYSTYQLSYVGSDRAMALLKTLGYEVIDLAGDTKFAREEGVEVEQLMRPIVYSLPDSADTSLNGKAFGTNVFGKVTTGVPQQRLLIAWRDSAELQRLLNLLNQHIDVAAKQILIEALVIELDRDHFEDLGFSYQASKDGSELSFQEVDGVGLPLLYDYTRPAAKTDFEFAATLKALAENGEAEVLSRPSVLVLDGRQARIDVEDRFPYSRVIRPSGKPGRQSDNLIRTTSYFNVGIVLNLRPRASEDDTEVTMRVETKINSQGKGGSASTADGSLIGPPLVVREVDTFVRVANDTPFIIGGLISTAQDVSKSGVPYLSKIPGIGALFRRTKKSETRKEVIIVLTPHIVPADDESFSFTVPRDSELFDRTDLTLFRNVYRVRREDLFDLHFIEESEFMQSLDRWVVAYAQDFYGRLLEREDKLPPEERRWTPVPEGDRSALARRLWEVQQQDPEVLRAEQEGILRETLPALVSDLPAEAVSSRRGMLEHLEGLVEEQWTQVLAQRELTPTPARDKRLKEMEAELWELEVLLQVAIELSSSRPATAFIQLLEGSVPGEDKFVKRMLLEMIEREKRDLSRHVRPEKILFYERAPGVLEDASRPILEPEPLSPRLRGLDRKQCETLMLIYPSRQTSQGLSFDPPNATVELAVVPDDDDFRARLRDLNRPGPAGHNWRSLAVLLNDCFRTRNRSTLEHLQSVLVLKRLLDLNPGLPLTLDGLHVGRDLLFPSETDLEQRHHVVDREAATLYYETLDYYFAFERTIRQVLGRPGIGRIVSEGQARD